MRTAAIVGTGLIGTPIAHALRARGVTTYLLDIDPVAAHTAEALGAGRAEEPSEAVDVAVLAVPPAMVGPELAALQKRGIARCYTDVAGVKSLPYRDVESHGCDMTTMVGGHPLAGGERSGPLTAQAELFRGRPWALVPSELTSDSALNTVLELVSLCGATPLLLDAETHDRAVALVSHLPHLLSSLMAAQLLPGEQPALRLAGQGLRDVTRTASGSSALWADILSANAGPLARVLEAFAADLSEVSLELRRMADHPDGRDGEGGIGSKLLDALELGVRGSSVLPGKYGGPHTAFAVVEVLVGDSPGELARLLGHVAALGVNIEDVEVEDFADQRVGRAKVSVLPGGADGLVAELRGRGWSVRR